MLVINNLTSFSFIILTLYKHAIDLMVDITLGKDKSYFWK